MANEILTEKKGQQIKEMEEFLKTSFCIDGECYFIEFVTVNNTLKPVASMMFALCDSKRGQFYVTISQ